MPINVKPETFDEDLLRYIESHKLDFNQGCIIKYVTRFQQKGEITDLLKAQFYIRRLIALEEARALNAHKERQASDARAAALEKQHNIFGPFSFSGRVDIEPGELARNIFSEYSRYEYKLKLNPMKKETK